MQQKPRAFSMLVAVALAIAAVPTASAFAAEDAQPPVVSDVAASPSPAAVSDEVTVTATVDDSLTGGSNILSAAVSVNGAAYTPLDAVDGAFDSPTEAVTGSFTIGQLGVSTICVQGTDSADLVSAPVCIDLTAESAIVFEGFFPPVKMDGDFVKAGRTIPLKWTLSQRDGSPISDLATFVGVFSYEVDCGALAGEPLTAVQEAGPGNAEVRARLNGDWTALWKTPKSYGDSCRKMYVLFSDGSTSPEVLFRFR